MDLKAIANFSSSHVGNVSPGQILYGVATDLAIHFIEHGLCEIFGKQGEEKSAPLASGPSSLSPPAGQALPTSNVATPANSEGKDVAQSSPLTPHSESSLTQMQSTDTTARGGKNTTPKRRGRPKKSQGTNGPQKPTA